MNAMTRRLVIGTAAVSMALSMAACGKAGGDKKDTASSGDTKSVGLLLPENASSTRYESFDRPFIEAKVKSSARTARCSTATPRAAPPSRSSSSTP